MTSPSSPMPLLVPMPRRVELTGGRGWRLPRGPMLVHGGPDDLLWQADWSRSGAPNAHIHLDQNPAYPHPGHSQGYGAQVTQEGVRIAAHGRAGLSHGLQTIRQLMRWARECNNGVVPDMRIDDAPEFFTRGVMLDISRCKVPTMPELFRIVDTLAGLKCNHIQLYTEHTFAYAGHEPVWADASPMTPAECRELDAYCRVRGIELSANQNCFGHLSRWLNLPAYAHLAETHGSWRFGDFTGERHGPFSLCPVDPASTALVADMLAQLLPCFNSPLVNIGCDETFDVGYGRSATAVKERGLPVVYMDFVREVAAIAQRHGKRPMLWADIALSHPEMLTRFPHDAIGLAWGYEPDSPFDQWGAALKTADIEGWVCPGTSSWRSITGRTTERTANIQAAALAGSTHRMTGFLMCDWGDNGHHQHWPIALNALAHGIAAAWRGPDAQGAPGESERGIRRCAIGLQCFDDPTGEAGRWLDDLGDVDAHIRSAGWRRRDAAHTVPAPIRNSSAMFIELYRPAHTPQVVASPEAWAEAQAKLKALDAHRPTFQNALIQREIRHTLDVAALAQDAALRPASARSEQEFGNELDRLMDEHAALWHMRNRDGGLHESIDFFAQVR